MSDLSLCVGIGDIELFIALVRGLLTRLKWHVVSLNLATLSETIQRILLGEAALLFQHDEQLNVVTDNIVVTTVQIMDERLDRLQDILKSGQMYIIIETNQPLPAHSDIIFSECGMNGPEPSECSPSHNISTCGANQLINHVPGNNYDTIVNAFVINPTTKMAMTITKNCCQM